MKPTKEQINKEIDKGTVSREKKFSYYSGFNSGFIAEHTSSNIFEYDHRLIKTIAEFEGFPVYLHRRFSTEDFLRELTKEGKLPPPKKIPVTMIEIFNNYFDTLYKDYSTKTNRYERVGIEDYKKQIKEKEILALKSVRKYVDYFESEYQTEFLGYCEEFIHWLDGEKKQTDGNPYPRIFINKKAFDLFDSLIKEIKERTKLVEVSFIFHRMQKDKLIYGDIKDGAFRKWLADSYPIDLDIKLKLYEYCTPGNKIGNYNKAIRLHEITIKR